MNCEPHQVSHGKNGYAPLDKNLMLKNEIYSELSVEIASYVHIECRKLSQVLERDG